MPVERVRKLRAVEVRAAVHAKTQTVQLEWDAYAGPERHEALACRQPRVLVAKREDEFRAGVRGVELLPDGQDRRVDQGVEAAVDAVFEP